MVCVLSYVVQVVVFSACSDALLGVGGAVVGACSCGQEYVFELVHARVCEHEGWVVKWDYW